MDTPERTRLAELLNSRPGRSPDRIPEILGLIEQLWSRHPDMRLGQLMVNLLDPTPNPIFAAEDEILRDRLRATLETGLWPTQASRVEDHK